ncbi:hypothetical protein BDD12DRAFT_901378 [Trichophaea hybrida]|nr:hypothetical protein BDD12DRAFT_901378 [Trichophaea hybrida]
MDRKQKALATRLSPSSAPERQNHVFGYNSDTAFSTAVTDIDDVARMVLERLDGKRQFPEEKKRPVVFVSHSLGGVVALILAHERSNIFNDLLDNVHGSVFFGVPHRGADPAYWGLFAGNLSRVFTLGRANTKYIAALKRNSQTLANISKQFIQIGASLEGRTFYEPETMFHQLIGLVNERAVGVAGANHREMCKFNDPESEKYSLVEGAVIQLVNSAVVASTTSAPVSLTEDEMQCLRCLYISDYESHKRRNPDRVAGTLEWFLHHAKYQNWRQEQKSSLLWVSADPGCGKSVLASFLVDELNNPQSQEELSGTVCYFFFKDDNEKQNNATFALSALLHQLFKTKSSCIKHAMKEFKSKDKKFTQGLDTLWNIFTAATTDPECGNVICIIDGLDECEKSTRDKLIHYLFQVFTPPGPIGCNSNEVFLKVIITSRPYVLIERRFRSLPEIRLKAEDETVAISSDIERVVDANIKELGIMLDLPEDVHLNLRHNLIQGADRTFLRVSLILNIPKDTAEALQNEFHKMLNNLPSDLDTVYEKILRDSPNPTKAKTILQIVVAAARPLTLDEMDIALAIRPGHKSIEDLKPYRPFSFESTVKEIYESPETDRRLGKASRGRSERAKGLVEAMAANLEFELEVRVRAREPAPEQRKLGVKERSI